MKKTGYFTMFKTSASFAFSQPWIWGVAYPQFLTRLCQLLWKFVEGSSSIPHSSIQLGTSVWFSCRRTICIFLSISVRSFRRHRGELASSWTFRNSSCAGSFIEFWAICVSYAVGTGLWSFFSSYGACPHEKRLVCRQLIIQWRFGIESRMWSRLNRCVCRAWKEAAGH